MTEDKIETAIGFGARADVLLANDVFTESFAFLERDYIEAWKQTAARDTDARERLWQAVQIVGKVRQHIVSVANNGKLARRELDDLAGKERRKLLGLV